MINRLPTLLVVCAMAWMALNAHRSPSPSYPGEEAAQTTSRDVGQRLSEITPGRSLRSTIAEGEFWHPLAHHYLPQVLLDGRWPPWDGFPDIPGHGLSFLIVGVPDPLDSSSGHTFDQIVDALQRAVETQHFVLDHFWFPWHAHGAKPPKADSSSTLSVVFPPKTPPHGGHASILDIHTSKRPEGLKLYERQPAVLLFRERMPLKAPPGTGTERLLMAFLIGETATAGMHKQALAASLQLIALSRSYQQSPEHFLGILGPFFSGSYESLNSGLGNWQLEYWTPALATVAVFGAPTTPLQTATSLTIAPHLLTIDPQLGSQVKVVSGSAAREYINDRHTASHVGFPTTSFSATVIPEPTILKELLKYTVPATAAHAKPPTVAFLYESNTRFGWVVKDQLTCHFRLMRDEHQPGPTSQHGLVSPIWIPFPLQISQIRTSYSKGRPTDKNTPSFLPTFGGELRIPLDEMGETRDIEPSLAPAMTAATTERIIDTILTSISREHVHYVVIVATDIRDKVFLARLIHKYCPDVQLLLRGTDLLFCHPDTVYELRGTLVGSTYPLFPANQEWSFPFRGSERRVVFSSEKAQGVYNAALALFHEPCSRNTASQMLDYGPPFVEHLDPTKSEPKWRPPVWIAMIGAGGFQPVQYFPLEKTDTDERVIYGVPAFCPSELRSPTLHLSAFWLLVFGVAVSCAYVWLRFWLVACRTLYPGPHGTATDTHKWWYCRENAQDPKSALFVWIRHVALALIIMYLATVCTVLVANASRLGRDTPVGVWPTSAYGLCKWAMCILVLAALAPPLWLVWGRFVPWVCERLQQSPSRFLGPPCRVIWAQLVLAGAAVLSCAVLWYTSITPSVDGWLWALRSSNLSNGVSPVFPVLFVAWAAYCWGSWELRRLYLLRTFSMANPLSRRGRAAYEKKVRALLRRPLRALFDGTLDSGVSRLSPRWMVLVALLIMFALLFYIWWIGYTSTVEGPVYTGCLWIAFAVLFLLLVLRLVRIWELWHSIQRLLVEIARLPLADAFARLPAALKRQLGLPLQTERLREYHLALRVRQARLVLGYYGRAREEITRAFDDKTIKALDHAFRYKAIEEQAYCQWKQAQKVWSTTQHGPAPEQFSLQYWSEAESVYWPEQLPVAPAGQQAAQVGGQGPPHSVNVLKGRLRQVSCQCLRVVQAFWVNSSVDKVCGTLKEDKDSRQESGDEKPGGLSQGHKSIPSQRQEEPRQSIEEPGVRQWVEAVEDFIALEVVSFISQFFVHLRSQATFVALVLPALLLLAILSYPLHPQRLLLLAFGGLVLVIAGTMLYLLVHIDKDELVSRVGGSTPGKVSWNAEFLGHLVTYVVPGLAIVTATYADASNLIHAWLEPVFRLLK